MTIAELISTFLSIKRLFLNVIAESKNTNPYFTIIPPKNLITHTLNSQRGPTNLQIFDS